MSWAARAVEELRAGREVTITPRGSSMTPIIHSGDEVKLRPLDDGEQLQRGHVVLARVRGTWYLHLIKAVDDSRERYLIGNNKGRTNGWTGRAQIAGTIASLNPRG